MTKKHVVDGLIANKSAHWTEEDRTYLMEQDEAQLAKFAPVANEDTPEDTPEDKPENKPESKPVDNSAVTMSEYLQSAPPELAGPLNAVVANHNKQHSDLVNELAANEAVPFSQEELVSKPIEELTKLKNMVQKPVDNSTQPTGAIPVFFGAATPATPTANQGGEETPLVAVGLMDD